MQSKNKLIGGVLLVSGTTIGAGMLALPISTGMAGFFPSTLLLIAYWLFMTFTAFLMLEVNLWLGEGANLISMAKKTLGRPGEIVSWAVYLFLLYSLTTAYIAGSGPIVIDLVEGITDIKLPSWAGTLPLFLVFGFFVYKGTRSVDYVNRALMCGLVITFAVMLFFLTPHVDVELLEHTEWSRLLLAISLVATSFGFHIIIPSLTVYLDYNVPLIKKTLLIGCTIPLAVYLLWELMALSILPIEGENGIMQGYIQGANGANLLSAKLNHSVLATAARCFSFFAIVTSFLGVSLCLFDFLADGLKIKKTRAGRAALYLMTFVPPLLFTLSNPRAFLSALEYAGAFGVIVLLALLPALMAWRGRYVLELPAKYTAPGGKSALLVVIGLSLVIIGIEIANKMGFLTTF